MSTKKTKTPVVREAVALYDAKTHLSSLDDWTGKEGKNAADDQQRDEQQT